MWSLYSGFPPFSWLPYLHEFSASIRSLAIFPTFQQGLTVASMDPPSTVTTPEHRTKGGLDVHEYGYTLSSIHRLRSLLLRESNNRGEFWSHAFQTPELPLICRGDQDFRVHIKSCHENPRSLRTEIVSHDANFHQILSDECGSSPASFM